MANQRQGVPAGWTWRDGRPRWSPSPTLRACGWKGLDLKDAGGRWLEKGPSITAAQAIVEAVAGWRGGVAVPEALAACAPPGAVLAGRPAGAPDRPNPRSIGALLDAWLASRESLTARNQADRRQKLGRFVDVLAGYAVGKPARLPKDPTPAEATAAAAYEAARARIRAASIFTLEPPSFDPDAGDVDDQAPELLYEVYWTAYEKCGPHAAAGILSEVSVWLNWCVKRRRAIPANWASSVDRKTPPGRIRVASWDELGLLIEAADAVGLPSIGDSIILGVDLSWSQADRLSLTWAQIDAAGRVKGSRQKTGRKGGTPLLAPLGLARLPRIRERQAVRFGPNTQPLHLLICELTGGPWNRYTYRHKFADVRTHAAAMAEHRAREANDPATRDHWAGLAASIVDLRDQDLRDTAVTVAYDAGLDLPEIASRTLQSLKRIHDLLDRHYGEIRAEVADRGAAKLEAMLKRKEIRL